MISRVARHGIPMGGAEDLAEVLGRGVSESLESVESSPQVLGGAFETAMTVARLRSLADPTANRLGTWEAYVLAMQVATAVFAAATADEDDTVECRIDGTLWDVPAIGAQEFTGPGAWLNAFWLGVVCQEPGRLSTLSRVPEEVLRGSGTEFDEYVYPWVAALQAFWNNGDELGDRLAEAVEGADPDRAEVAGAELMLKVLYPPLVAFLHVVQRDQEGFDSALAEGVQLYQQYWSVDEERRSDPEGAVALALLSVACLARDAGLSVNVESEYLPKHLLGRSWIGEFPT